MDLTDILIFSVVVLICLVFILRMEIKILQDSRDFYKGLEKEQFEFAQELLRQKMESFKSDK